MKAFRSILIPASIALMLGACGPKEESAPTAESSEPLAEVAPPAGQTWANTVSKTAEGGYVMGNPEAPIKLVEFASLTCPHCREFADEAFNTIRDKYVASGRVSFELRNYVRDGLDLTAAMLTRCGTDTSYFPLTEQAFSYQDKMFEKAQGLGQDRFQQLSTLPEDQRYVALADALGLTDFFAQRGISRDQANQCLANAETANALANHTGEATQKFNIEGTPTFMINGSKIDFTGWPELEATLQQMGAR